MVLASTGIYLIEHEVQPEQFGSIPAAMWWAMATLTTVGYGDVVPITMWGRFFGGTITLLGMGMVALPAGILASSFSEQAHQRRETFRLSIQNAMKDGKVSVSDRGKLETLRHALDMDKEEAELLINLAPQDQHTSSASHCPHCGKPIK